MQKIAARIFKLRIPILAGLTAVTVFLGYNAFRLQIGADFNKLIPQYHEYIENCKPFKDLFSSGNQIKVEVSLKNGTILTYEYLTMLRNITEDIKFTRGISRRTVRSLISRETQFVLIDEYGFSMGRVVPSDLPQTKEGLEKIGESIILARLKGIMVSMDMKSSLITADIEETGADYYNIYQELNKIREKYSNENVSVHIVGFSMVAGFVNDALGGIFALFGLAIIITFLILWVCFRHVKLAVLPIVTGGIAVLWSLGIVRLMGMSLDPMTTIVPFLVVAVSVSHAIQMIKRFLEECECHTCGYDSALFSLAGLLLPGSAALATDALGFITILLIPVGIIQDLAISASIGICCIIIANILGLTLILSYYPVITLCREERDPLYVSILDRILIRVSGLTHGRNAYKVAAVSLVLLIAGLFTAIDATVGDVNPGEPLLWEDSIYNKDAGRIMNDFLFGTDYLSVIVAGEEQGICKDYEILKVIDDFEYEIGAIPGVTFVMSPLFMVKIFNELFREGDMRWRCIPQDSDELRTIMGTTGSYAGTEFMDVGCQTLVMKVFLGDHKGDTIRTVIDKLKEFISKNPLKGAKFLLAGGNAGIMAATNEVVSGAQFKMMALVFLSIFIITFIIFRDLKSSVFILIPLFLVSILSTTFMKLLNLGLNVNTLPVASLGVGIGVDYGIYIYSRLKEELKARASFEDAVIQTLKSTGAAVLYTAMTLSAGVLIWLFSDLKFQADMGILLGFLFIMNMIGAMVLLPALVYIFNFKGKKV
ncbi:MAG: MMPL family transporter [Spirochaetes bacterium]|nr:MMPL family transporter [Spirochaetota bacterium]